METICNPIQVNNDDHNNDAIADNALKKAASIKSASGANDMETLNNHHRKDESATTAAPTTKNSTVKQQLYHQNDNDEPKVVVASNQPIESTNIKIKRCKHGRIIIKDSSKKKPTQHGDIKETNPNQSRIAEQVSFGEKKLDKDDSFALNRQVVDKVAVSNQNLSITTAATTTCSDRTTNRIVDSPVGSDIVYGPKEKDSTQIKYSSNSKLSSQSGDNNNNANNNNIKSKRRTRSRSKSPSSRDRKRDSQSPSHRKSPRRYRDRSPRERQRSRSPRRRELSREKGSWKTSHDTSSNRSSSTRRNRLSVRQDRSPSPSSSHRRGKRSPPNRYRNSRRRYSESLSDDSRVASPNNLSRHRSNSIRSPETRRDRYPRTSGIDISRDSIFGKSPTRTIDNLDKDLSGSNATKETFTPKQVPPSSGVKPPLAQQPLPTISSQASNCITAITAQPQPSPEKSPLSETSLTPTTDGSISSDIYDPEGPIIPISPGDSPPLSPPIKAAKHCNNNNNINNNNHQIAQNSSLTDSKNEKNINEDDVPSSAVELNKKEKYLQKLNRQERVVEEIKIALKPHYQKRAITKEQYKDVLRRAVPKICHSKDGEINPVKIRILVEAYVKKMKKKNRSR